MSSVGFVAPNGTALALVGHGDRAGSAAALIGVAQFTVGAVAAPLTGVGGQATALPLAVVVLVLTLVAGVVVLLTQRSARAA